MTAVADQRPDWLAVAGELVDCGGSVQAGRAGNEDCHGQRLLVEVGWVNPSAPRGVKLPSAWSQRVFHCRLPADSERVEVLGEASLLHLWLERVCLR